MNEEQIKELREKFLKECTDKIHEYRQISMTPHDLFEWIKTNCLKGQQEDKWISVEDKLPEDRILPCLVFNENSPTYSQHILQATWFLESKKFKIKTIYPVIKYIPTHWQPLPNPPKTK